jgi:hypothetical protein
VNYTAQYENVPEGYRNPEAAKCELQYQVCINDGGLVKDCTDKYNTCMKDNVTSKNTGEEKEEKKVEIDGDYADLMAAALKGQQPSTAFETYMKEIQSKFGTEYPKPSQTSLDLAQGGGVNPEALEKIYDLYKEGKIIIKPHEDVPKEKSSITIEQPNAPDIPLTQTSIRQQIRDDIKKAVKEEIDTIDNEYEIKYVSQ